MRAVVTGNLTPEIVAKCNAAEQSASESYLDAARFIPRFAARWVDSDDVASVARIILADTMDSGLTGSLAAGAACKRAAQWFAKERKQNTDPMLGAVSMDAERDTLGDLEAGEQSAPDRIARWTDRDALGAVWDSLDDTSRAVMGALRLRKCWTESGRPNVSAICRALYGDDVPRALRDLVTEAVRQALGDLGDAAGDLPAWVTLAPRNGADAAKRERGTLRDTRGTDSGTASAVVRTLASGARWVTLADRSIRVDDTGAAYVLGQVDTLAPHHVIGSTREAERATLGQASALERSARPVCGVSAGMIWGSAGVAGTGSAPRPSAPRKRRRDGGIGASMIPA